MMADIRTFARRGGGSLWDAVSKFSTYLGSIELFCIRIYFCLFYFSWVRERTQILEKNQLSEKNEVASWTIRLRNGPLVSPLGDHTTRTDDKGGEMTWTNPEEATRSGRGQHNTG